MRVFNSIVVTLAVLLAGCGGDDSGKVAPVAEQTADTLVIYTVNYPLAFFAERIGGDLVEVVFPAPVDEDPAFWSPVGCQCRLGGVEIRRVGTALSEFHHRKGVVPRSHGAGG